MSTMNELTLDHDVYYYRRPTRHTHETVRYRFDRRHEVISPLRIGLLMHHDIDRRNLSEPVSASAVVLDRLVGNALTGLQEFRLVKASEVSSSSSAGKLERLRHERFPR